MTKTAPKRKNNKNRQAKASRVVRVGRVMGGGSILSDPRVRAWDMLLRDPCAANLASPCYSGTDSGYLVRTTDFIYPTAVTGLSTGTVGANGPSLDAFLQYTPFNLSSTSGYFIGASSSSSASLTCTATGAANFITNGVVFRYRPIAACLKWIPTGPYGNRSGSVGQFYSPGQVATGVNNSGATGHWLADCQKIAPNGSTVHEVRWLPTAVDENFTELAAPNNTGAGAIGVVLRGVDSTYATNTSASFNGYCEITTVWEWVPQKANGISVAPRAPLPYTSQQVLSTIGDLGAYLFEGVRDVGRGMVKAGTFAGVRYLTAGVAQMQMRGGQNLIGM